MSNKLVSIVIPTENSAKPLLRCLKSIRDQLYTPIETIIVDGKSTDKTLAIAQQFNCRVFTFIPKVKKNAYNASHKRNFGAHKARGTYVYWVDADMLLPKKLIQEAVQLCENRADAVIVPEDSFGRGPWAKAKNLERRCYWEDTTVEAPRFFKRTVLKKIKWFDESLGAGGDDLDIYLKTIEAGFTVHRSKNILFHDEGHLTLKKLFLKRFRYGRDTLKYFRKRPLRSVVSFFPLHPAYLKHWRMFVKRPTDTYHFIIMRSVEYIAGFLGIMYSYIDRTEN